MSDVHPRLLTLAIELETAKRENLELLDEVLRESGRSEKARVHVIDLQRRLDAAEQALSTDTRDAQRYSVVRSQLAFYSSVNRHLQGDDLDAVVDAALTDRAHRYRIGEKAISASPHEHQCDWCGVEIAAREVHRHWRQASDPHGDLLVIRMHPECALAEGGRHTLLRAHGWRRCLETRGVAAGRVPESL